MKKILLVLVLFTIHSFSLKANDGLTQTIRGTIVDKVTELPLIGASVILLNTNPPVGTITDINGEFIIENVPLGRQGVEISYVGYHNSVINNLLLTSGKETVLQIKMEEKMVSVDEVVIVANSQKSQTINDLAKISARSFTVEETERFAGSLGDPARMVANYAGVMTQNDSRNDIIIRGNSPIGVLWRLDDIEIPNPNHFGALGTTGGPVSMLNNNLLTNSDFLTSAFPAEYGNAISGVFDLNMRSGNNKTQEYTGQIGFNGFEFGAEGPLLMKEKSVRPSYLINYRYSTLEVMKKLGFDFGTGSAIPEYDDLTFIINVPGTKLGRFKLIGLYGNSFIEMGKENDSTSNSYNARGTQTDFGSNLGVIGLTHTVYLNEKSRVKTIVSAQKTGSNTKFDSLKYNTGITIMPFYRSNLNETKYSFSTQYRYKQNVKNNYSLGFTVDYSVVDFVDSVFLSNIQEFRTNTNTQGDMMLYKAYAQWQHRFTEDLTFYSGIYSQQFSLNDQISFEPRLSLEWKFKGNQSLNVGFGRHSQTQPKTVYFEQAYNNLTGEYVESNKDLGFTFSDHYVIGYNLLFSENFRFRAETYYQDLSNVPVSEKFPEFSMLNAGDFFAILTADSLVNKGTGYNYGAEFTLEKFLSTGYYFLFTASLFESKYKGYDEILRNTAFNGNYVFNLLGGYEFKIGSNAMLTLDIKTVLAGGKRYTPIDLVNSVTSTERDWDNAYSEKYPDYFRTDFRIGIKTNSAKFSQEWALDLQNITGYQSIFMEQFDPEKQEVYQVYQQGFMPMFLYRIQF